MKERGIIQNTEMVRAILEGRKTTIRIPVKNVQIDDYDKNDKSYGPWTEDKYGDSHKTADFCPYGKVGDWLYVRETWGISGRYKDGIRYEYKAFPNDGSDFRSCRYRPPATMPKSAARIWLVITGVRVERIQDITEEQARSEGIKDGGCLNCGEAEPCGCGNPHPSAVDAFAYMFDMKYKNWVENPWSYVIEFRVLPFDNIRGDRITRGMATAYGVPELEGWPL